MEKKTIVSVLIVLLVILGLGYFLVYRPYKNIRAKANVVVASAKELKTAFTQNNIDLVKEKLTNVSDKYKDLENESKSVYWAAFIPYIRDYKNGIEAGRYMIHAGQQSVDAIYPYADLIGFKKGQTSFVEKSAEDRLQTAVLTLDKVLTKIDGISEDINQAEKRINTIDPNRYPEKFSGKPLRSQIASIKEQFAGVSSLFVDSKPFLKKLPTILGKDKAQTYLILFQNDKEQRATGGFLTAYAVFTIKSGKMSIEKSEDIYALDDSISVHPAAPDKIQMYHINVPKLNIRDSNLSPDYVESLKIFNSLYQKSSQKVNYDGIFAIDTHILVDMLRVFGDTEAQGTVFSAKQDARCDCPQVIYQLSYQADRRTGYIRTNRKGILGDLMYALFYKAIGFSPSKYWGTLFQTMLTNLDEKHILLNFNDPQIQASIEKLNYAGRMRSYDGDFLNITNVNFAGAKSNLFVSEVINSETTTSNGTISRAVTIDYKNPYPASDCSLKTENGLCLNAPLRNWIRVYVPKGSQLVSFNGSQTKVLTYDELGKTVFEGFLVVNPMGKSTVTVKYTLPSTIASNNYSLLLQKQAGESSQKLKVLVDGKKLFDGDFNTDKEIKNK